jgi:hypothetical protein
MHMGSNERGAYYDKTGKGQRYLSDAVVDAQKNWPTLQTSDQNGAASSDRPAHRKQLRDVEHGLGLHAPANPSTDGSRQGLWLTPRANEPDSDPNFAARNADRGAHCHGTLSSQAKRAEYQQTEKGVNLHKPIQTQVLHEVEKMWRTPSVAEEKNQNTSTQIYLQNQVGATPKSWATPRAQMANRLEEITEDNRDQLANRNKSNLEEEIAGHCGKATGKLNPRWVETLMGLPIGWTMPSCTSPQTIAPMSCDCLETESSQPPQNEHLELF